MHLESQLALEIDGKKTQVPAGSSILDALRARGIEIPALCHDERLKPAAACRLCQVELEGSSKTVCACSTPVTEGMKIRTQSAALDTFRKGALELLARRYSADAVEKFPEKPFHQFLKTYGVKAGAEAPAEGHLVDKSHPYFQVDMQRCVECYRCVRICREVQGKFIWKVENRGDRTRIVTDAMPGADKAVLTSGCVSCGACADTCPTGALEDVSVLKMGAPERWTRTTCPYCGTGCEMLVGVRGDQIVKVKPDLEGPVNHGHLCVKGRYGWGFVDAKDRVTDPMIRRNGKWEKASWDEAIAEAARLLNSARAKSPDAVGVLASSRSTNEESYLTAKLARFLIGTNNVDCCARVCHGPSAAGLGLIFGTGAATNSFEDIEKAKAFLMVGTNPTENHPIVGERIRQRMLAGVPAIVIDPRRTEVAALATIHLKLKPGTNIPMLNALANELIQQGFVDRDFIAKRTEGYFEFVDTVCAWSAERAGKVCGVDPELIRQAAKLYGSMRPAMMFHGLGITEHIQGTDSVMALAHLAMLTGNVGRPGSGVNPLRGQNNVQGTANMGCEPSRLTGYQKIEYAREVHEKVWGRPIPNNPGLSAVTMMDAAIHKDLKSILLVGYDLLLSHPNLGTTRRALESLDSLIILDLFFTKTAQEFGNVFLPACSSFEKDGTFMNSERRVQKIRPAISRRGQSKTDLEIIQLLARAMGEKEGFDQKDSSAVWDEIRKVWPAGAGINYDRIEEQGIQWPCPSESHPGTQVLHGERFPVGVKARFRRLEYMPSSERVSEEFPFILNTGRTLFHFNAATMTGRTRNREIRRDDWIQVHPEDAARAGVRDGARVRVTSRHGSFHAVASVTDAVRAGELFTTFHAPELLVNLATGQGRDAITHTPEYKVTAVAISPA